MSVQTNYHLRGTSLMSESALKPPKPPKDPKTVTIFINTRPYEVEKKDLVSFEEVVALAYPDTPPGGNVGYSVLYESGHGGADGTLVAGESVKVKEGMRFDVTATDRS
jgi:hypothetical protein